MLAVHDSSRKGDNSSSCSLNAIGIASVCMSKMTEYLCAIQYLCYLVTSFEL